MNYIVYNFRMFTILTLSSVEKVIHEKLTTLIVTIYFNFYIDLFANNLRVAVDDWWSSVNLLNQRWWSFLSERIKFERRARAL